MPEPANGSASASAESFRKCDPSGSLSNWRLAVRFDFAALRAAWALPRRHGDDRCGQGHSVYENRSLIETVFVPRGTDTGRASGTLFLQSGTGSRTV